MGIALSKNENGKSVYCVISEYMKNNSLHQYIHEEKKKFSEKNLINMLEDIGLGMVF